MNLPAAQTLLELFAGAGLGVGLMDAEGRFLYVNERLGQMNGLTPEEHAGLSVDDVVPQFAPAIHVIIARALNSGEPVVSAGFAGSAGGATGTWEASYVPVSLGDRPGLGVLVVDTTERERAVAETRRRLSQQAALADLSHLGLRESDPEAVLSAATAMLTRELDADLSGVMRLDPSSGHLVMAAGSGFPPGATMRVQGDVGRLSGAGYTLTVDDVVITEDTETEDRFEFAAPLLALGVRSSISVTIPGADGPFGVLAALARRPHGFDEHDAVLLRATANVLGAAVLRAAHETQLAGLAAQRGRLVAETLDTGEREQRQLADVLHEDVLQHVLFARLELASLEAAETDKARVMASLDTATRLVRELVGSLRPVTLSHAGLAAALEALCLQLQERSGLRTDLDVDPACEGVADDLVHGAVRELLTHATSQAGASRARVAVSSGMSGVEILVAAEGGGMDPQALQAALGGESAGLTSLQERIAGLGGSVAVTGGTGGRGAAIELVLPA